MKDDRSKLELEGDVRLLYDLLERARRERRCYASVVSRLERTVQDAATKIAEASTNIVYRELIGYEESFPAMANSQRPHKVFVCSYAVSDPSSLFRRKE